MNTQNSSQNIKLHSGSYQIEKEYPEIYSNFLINRLKLLRSCPNDWKSICQSRADSLKPLIESFHPDQIKSEILEKCEGYSKGPTHLLECKSKIYSARSTKLIAESQKIENFLSNLTRFTYSSFFLQVFEQLFD
jgi:hypothetical protein